MCARLIQAKSLLLLLVFLAAGTSLPSLDSLLFHGNTEGSQRGRIHVEPAGGCLEHAGHCVLGRTATGAGAVATLAPDIRVGPSGGTAGQLIPKCLLSTVSRGLPNCRAPPVLLV